MAKMSVLSQQLGLKGSLRTLDKQAAVANNQISEVTQYAISRELFIASSFLPRRSRRAVRVQADLGPRAWRMPMGRQQPSADAEIATFRHLKICSGVLPAIFSQFQFTAGSGSCCTRRVSRKGSGGAERSSEMGYQGDGLEAWTKTLDPADLELLKGTHAAITERIAPAPPEPFRDTPYEYNSSPTPLETQPRGSRRKLAEMKKR